MDSFYLSTIIFFSYFYIIVIIFSWTLFTLFFISVLLTFLRWTIALSGKIIHDNNQLDYSLCGILGSNNFGIGIKKNPGKLFFFLGKENRKIFSFLLKSKIKNGKTNSKRKKIQSHNILRFILAVYPSIKLHSLDLNGELGLKNPANTGKVWGGLIAIRNGLFNEDFNVNIQPNFNKHLYHIKGTTKIEFCPAVFAWRLARFYFGF